MDTYSQEKICKMKKSIKENTKIVHNPTTKRNNYYILLHFLPEFLLCIYFYSYDQIFSYLLLSNFT